MVQGLGWLKLTISFGEKGGLSDTQTHVLRLFGCQRNGPF